MNVETRKELLVQLGDYMNSDNENWKTAQHQASIHNPWFTPEFIQLAVQTISNNYLSAIALQQLIDRYAIQDSKDHPKKVGIVMAGNIPLVGFHDLLCSFLGGQISIIKPSSKDEVLIKHLAATLQQWNPEVADYIVVQELLNNCDAYIATGSNNSSRYFEQYFSRFPHIIRKNRTSAAILTGGESYSDLQLLADDVHQYFGLGCRNVTKLYVPEKYSFEPLLDAFKKYQYLMNYNKYKNNYDYNLAILLLNNKYYMTNGSLLLLEDPSLFSPISQLNFSYYSNKEEVLEQLTGNEAVQCLVGANGIPFGAAQHPSITDYADGVDTMAFIVNLSKDNNEK